MAEGVEVKLDVNELLNQAASAWTSVAVDSAMEYHLCRNGEAIPKDPQFQELSGWDAETKKTICSITIPHAASWVHYLGFEPTKFDVICTYRTNGQFHGKGKFIQNVDIMVDVQHVGVACSAIVTGTFDDPPANRGTPEDPLAELVAHIEIQPRHADWNIRRMVVWRGDGSFEVTAE